MPLTMLLINEKSAYVHACVNVNRHHFLKIDYPKSPLYTHSSGSLQTGADPGFWFGRGTGGESGGTEVPSGV